MILIATFSARGRRREGGREGGKKEGKEGGREGGREIVKEANEGGTSKIIETKFENNN